MKKGIKSMFGRRFKAGGYSAFAAVLVIIIAVMANMMVGALPSSMTQWDLTEQELFNLSDQTKKIVSTVDKDVNIYLLSNAGSEDSTITRLLDRYKELNSHIKVEYVDPTNRPTFLQQFDLTITRLSTNSVIVACENKSRLIQNSEIFVTTYQTSSDGYSYTTNNYFDGENVLTNAIHYVSNENLPKLYALTGHGETELSDNLIKYLEQDNYAHDSLNLLTQEAVPEDADCVLINAPQNDISADELERLLAYLNNGGSVFMATSYIEEGEMENLKTLSSKMGIEIGNGLIFEGDSNMYVPRYPYIILPDINVHTITNDLITNKYYAILSMTQPLTQVESTDATVTSLLETSQSAYAKVAGVNSTTVEKEEGDYDGPFNVAMISELNEGKLVTVTTGELLSDNLNQMVSGTNFDLFLNALSYMTGHEESISIRMKSLDIIGLTVPEAKAGLWSMVLIGVVPAAMVILGVVISIKRKRR